MKPEKKMSQEQFDEQLRREFSRADEAQKRVLDKIMSMSEEERRQMAAGVPGPETPEELLGERTPAPRRNIPRRPVRLAFMAASIAICVMSFGMFAVGNKNYEYKVLESGGNVLANNTDVIVVPEDINREIMICANKLRINAVHFSEWPEDITINKYDIYESDALIECAKKNRLIFIQMFIGNVDSSFGSINNGTIVSEVDNPYFKERLKIYEVTEDDGSVSYFSYLIADNCYYKIVGFESEEELRNILENCEI